MTLVGASASTIPYNVAYDIRIRPLVEYFADQHGKKTQVVYYITELPLIADHLKNSKQVVNQVLKILDDYSERDLLNPPLAVKHLAAAYYFATRDTGERRMQKDIATEFGIPTKTLCKGIRDLTDILSVPAKPAAKGSKA
jgi:transcription initiation factor TFIIIB Brf1 subunit/transcription initiation factor TFIIB